MKKVDTNINDQTSDEDLMDSLQNAKDPSLSESAFTIIYKRYGTLMLNYFYRMLWKDREKAEDFVHDLFAKIYHKNEQFDLQRNFKTWIYSIANNMCKNEYKKQSIRANTTSGIDPYAETLGDQQQSANQKTHLSMFKAEFQKALDALDEKHSIVFTLRHLQDLSIKEIAQSIDKSEGTVKSRLFYATKKLAAELAHFQKEID